MSRKNFLEFFATRTFGVLFCYKNSLRNLIFFVDFIKKKNTEKILDNQKGGSTKRGLKLVKGQGGFSSHILPDYGLVTLFEDG